MVFSTISILLVFVCVTSSSAPNHPLRSRERRGLSRPTILSYWGTWGSWSACSRTCGGGVASQARVCLMRSRGEEGQLRESTHCVGLYKQYKLCNSEPCPDNKDYRQEQCESYNDVPFMGKLYEWKAIKREPNLCELNCKAVGSHFFAKLADKVVDGTPCRNSSSTEICVDGMCRAIGCDGILGSGLKLDKCGVCGGTNTQCEVMSGVFTSNSMGHGYHKIATIPTGAMYINVTEITKSRNYLALEGTNGNKYINMDWKIDAPGNYSIAGTFFIYKRSPGRTGVGEQFFADGPTTEDLNLILINQQKNPGISYEYSVPKTAPSEEVEEPSVPDAPQGQPAAPERVQVNIRPDAPASKSQVSGGVSLSSFLNAGQPAPVFPSTGSKRNPVKSSVEPPVLPPQEGDMSFNPEDPQGMTHKGQAGQRAETNPSGQKQSGGQETGDQEADTRPGSGPRDHGQFGQDYQGTGRGHNGGTGHHKGRHHGGDQQDSSDRDSGRSDGDSGGHPRDGDSGGHLYNGQQEEPQADSGTPVYPGSPLRGVDTQARELPEPVYPQAGTGNPANPAQGQSYPPKGRDHMYPTQGDGVSPGRGTGVGQPPVGSNGRGYVPPNTKPSNPYPGSYQTYDPNQDPAGSSNPYYPNPNPNPYPNPNPNRNPNPYPNANPYPNQNANPYPNPNPYGNQRPYPNSNPYPNPNPNPNNPYPSRYPNRYPNVQDTPGRQPSNPYPNQQPQTPFLQIDPIESRRGSSEGSSVLGSSDFSALESGRYGVREETQPLYGWIDAGLTECSASCAGGIQHTQVDCIEWRTFRPQDHSLCDATRRPNVRQLACNIEACPPVWEVTEWMECSRTCGTGRQMRQVSCKQTLTQVLTTMVPAERCDRRLEPDRVQECHMEPCTSWRAGDWGECNVACGEGRRHREVKCVSDSQEELQESACADKRLSKPRSEEVCDMGPCISNWFVSEWNDLCSAECGGGHKSRYVVCTTEGNGNVLRDDACNTITKPRTSRTCNNMPCGAVWLTSEWSQCTRECGDGIQTRMVLCAGADEPHIVVNEEQCAMKPKPTDRQSCKLKECEAVWFNSDWTQCSRTCGGGQRKRDIKCLDENMNPSTRCSEEKRPAETQSCNIQQCTTSIPASDCRDKFTYCEKVAKARLCTYMYYRKNCCFSCYSHTR